MAIQERPRGDLRCSKCDAKIGSDHPYAWCIKCGTPLPEDVRARLSGLGAVKSAAAEAAEARRREQAARAKELVVEGRAVQCPICGHDRFRTRGSRSRPLFDAEWAGEVADSHVCGRCGHVLWFIRG